MTDSTNIHLYAERFVCSIPAFYKPQLLWSLVQRCSSLLGANSCFQSDGAQFRAVIERRDVQRHDSNGMLWGGEGSCSSYDKELAPWQCGTWRLASSPASKCHPDIAFYIHSPKCIQSLQLWLNSTAETSTHAKQYFPHSARFLWVLSQLKNSFSSLPCYFWEVLCPACTQCLVLHFQECLSKSKKMSAKKIIKFCIQCISKQLLLNPSNATVDELART